MPKNKSKAQQRKMFVLAKQGKISLKEARARAVKGKAYRRLPSRKRRKK